ncbi:predicted protein [Naegleria gruberi]|uniref:Predicted protein n=1 Tax=Naegleria gruberi TaxID=5762 RepID=D2VL02_NAEGR|nr:uncharacterized protein NAEGRDRAFT_69613 [Naegleria gruberi]EFC42536.1 predicted protein [Naegleria gruberi]|eukprot:XP_002675280.1 predicted protein [Naegleria gruberi strain NEG-M]
MHKLQNTLKFASCLKKQHFQSYQLLKTRGWRRNMSGTIPRIIDHKEIDDSDWKSLFQKEPSAFTKLHSGMKSDGLIYMIGLRGGNDNNLAITGRSREFFDIDNRGFVLLSEISDSTNQKAKVFSREEIPFKLENLRETDTSLQEVYLSMDNDVGFTIDILAFDVYESVESIQVFYFNENSKQAIINSIEKYKAEIQEVVNQGFKSDGLIPRDAFYSQGYPHKFIELLQNRVQYHRVSNFYQLPIPPIYEKSKQSNRNHLIICGLLMIFLLFQVKKEFSTK